VLFPEFFPRQVTFDILLGSCVPNPIQYFPAEGKAASRRLVKRIDDFRLIGVTKNVALGSTDINSLVVGQGTCG
jgi:hypothetical protein